MRFGFLLAVGILIFSGASAWAFDCSNITLPSTAVICTDPELSRLADKRQQAFNEAMARADPKQQKKLLADQTRWVRSYATECGVPLDRPAPNPVPAAVKECFKQAGEARIAYLRAHGAPSAAAPSQAAPQPAPTPIVSETGANLPARIGPSFDCGSATHPLALMICASARLSRDDLRFVQAFQALLHQVGEAGRSELWQEAIDFQNSVLQECAIPATGPVSGSPDCVARLYRQQRSLWLARLHGPAREEAVRPIRHHLGLQAKLRSLGFLPATARIDGVYGPGTRTAIVAWQGMNGRPETGFLSDADVIALEGAAPREAEGAAPPPAQSAPASVKPPSAPPVASGSALPPAEATTSPAVAAPAKLFPPSTVQAPSGPTEVISLINNGGLYVVPVRINGAITLNFVIDSGASIVLLPADVVLTLARTGTIVESDFIGKREYRLADGSTLKSTQFTLRKLQVGTRTLHDVTASVGPVSSEPLLGQSFLSRLGSWAIDNSRHVLRLSGSSMSAETEPVGAGLAISLMTPVRTPGRLAIRGDVTNNSETPREVPRLRVALRDAAAEVVAFKIVELPKVELMPGEVEPFNTLFENAPDVATAVFVTFEPN